MAARKKGFAVCLRDDGFVASLEVRKLYAVISDPDAEANNLIRVIDESGDDYLYPARLFRKLALPSGIQRALSGALESRKTHGHGKPVGPELRQKLRSSKRVQARVPKSSKTYSPQPV
jgi:hypothetical protein